MDYLTTMSLILVLSAAITTLLSLVLRRQHLEHHSIKE